MRMLGKEMQLPNLAAFRLMTNAQPKSLHQPPPSRLVRTGVIQPSMFPWLAFISAVR